MNREWMKGRVGKTANAWKGMTASYEAKHIWIVKHYGNAQRCEKCKTTTAKRYEWANISGKYLRERSDYTELCPSCHRLQDHGNRCKYGHTLVNVYHPPKHPTWRICRKCQSLRNQQYAKNNKI